MATVKVPTVTGKLSKAHAVWLPRTLTIRGMEHIVVTMASMTAPDGGTAWGYYSGENNVILISRETPPAARGMVLLHEAIHGLCNIDNLGIDVGEEGEANVRMLGNGINEVIMSNRKAWDRIWRHSTPYSA